MRDNEAKVGSFWLTPNVMLPQSYSKGRTFMVIPADGAVLERGLPDSGLRKPKR